MKYDYDLICIGLGPAGMAVSVMGAEMGLKVCGIEREHIGGECMNVGCIPSKSLLRMARARHAFERLEAMGLSPSEKPAVKDALPRVRDYVRFINENKTLSMFKKVDLVLKEGPASLVDAHTVETGGKRRTARRIFIATGSRPAVPPIPGLAETPYLTNLDVFDLDRPPASLTILGGGSMGCELAQAFARLGTRCTLVHRDARLLPAAEPAASAALEDALTREGVVFHNGVTPTRIAKTKEGIVLEAPGGLRIVSDVLLVAAGRKPALEGLGLERAGVRATGRGITVDRYLRTSRPSVYAVGDCNGENLLTHAAMHQGMTALMNALLPFPFRMDFRKTPIAWTVFTDPEISQVGAGEEELRAKGIRYEVFESRYENYGAAIAEDAGTGFVRALASPAGKIYGACIVGEGSGEMINEWTLALRKGLRLHDILLTPHSFPTMGFLTKRVSEAWAMGRMKSKAVQAICRFMFRA